LAEFQLLCSRAGRLLPTTRGNSRSTLGFGYRRPANSPRRFQLITTCFQCGSFVRSLVRSFVRSFESNGARPQRPASFTNTVGAFSDVHGRDIPRETPTDDGSDCELTRRGNICSRPVRPLLPTRCRDSPRIPSRRFHQPHSRSRARCIYDGLFIAGDVSSLARRGRVCRLIASDDVSSHSAPRATGFDLSRPRKDVGKEFSGIVSQRSRCPERSERERERERGEDYPEARCIYRRVIPCRDFYGVLMPLYTLRAA